MQITAVCPFCKEIYHLEDSLLGKAIRCKNTACQRPFVVQVEAPPVAKENGSPRVRTEAAVPSPQVSGVVGEMVPFLPTVAEEPRITAPIPEPIEVPELLPDWMNAPPPVRRDSSEPQPAPTTARRPTRPIQKAVETKSDSKPTRVEKQRPAAETTPVPPSGPVEIDAGSWEAPPPIRRGAEAEPKVEAQPTHEDIPHAGPATARWARRIVIALVAVVVLVLGWTGVYLFRFFAETETREARAANQSYESGAFGDAKDRFKRLGERFPKSEKKDEYAFMEDVSALRMTLTDISDPIQSLTDLQSFITQRGREPFWRTQAAAVTADAARKLAAAIQREAKKPGPQAKDLKESVPKLRDLVGANMTAPQNTDLDAAVRELLAAEDLEKRRSDTLTRLASFLDENRPFRADQLKAFSLALRQEAPRIPGLASEPRVEEIYKRLLARHRQSVTWEPGPARDQIALDAAAEEDAPSLFFDPALIKASGNERGEEKIVLALVRGVLYGQHRDTGDVLWARRVGIDTTMLPVRVPASGANPELILVISADTKRIDSLGHDGPASVAVSIECFVFRQAADRRSASISRHVRRQNPCRRTGQRRVVGHIQPAASPHRGGHRPAVDRRGTTLTRLFSG